MSTTCVFTTCESHVKCCSNFTRDSHVGFFMWFFRKGTSVKLQECNAASLNFNGISFFTHPVLCTIPMGILKVP